MSKYSTAFQDFNLLSTVGYTPKLLPLIGGEYARFCISHKYSDTNDYFDEKRKGE